MSSSFQYLVNSWSTIVELISIYKRLHAFEARIEGRSLVSIVNEEEAEEASLPRPRLNDAGLLAPVVLSEGRI